MFKKWSNWEDVVVVDGGRLGEYNKLIQMRKRSDGKKQFRSIIIKGSSQTYEVPTLNKLIIDK